MKKIQQRVSITVIIGFVILISCIQIAQAEYTGKSPTTTDPTNAKYYNNDLKNNGALSEAAKNFAANNKSEAQKIIGANNGQCGIQCAAAMDAASKSSNAGLVPLESVDVNGNRIVTNVTAGDPTEDQSQAEKNRLNRAKANANSSTATDNILGLEESKLKAGDVDMNTIPLVIVNVISTLLAIAGTVAIFSLIYHAVKMQINSGITGDSSGVDSAKKGMIGALIGFVIAISAWFLVTQAVSLLGSVT